MINNNDYVNMLLSRADITSYLYHFTKRGQYGNALDTLLKIIRDGFLIGSDNSGFIRGNRRASCFMDIPFAHLPQSLTPANSNRYEPYGIFVTKKYAYMRGARPVCYLSKQECQDIGFPPNELWRVGTFEMTTDDGIISFMHEREWRCPEPFGSYPRCFLLPNDVVYIVVNTNDDARVLFNGLQSNNNYLLAKHYCIYTFENSPQSVMSARQVKAFLYYTTEPVR